MTVKTLRFVPLGGLGEVGKNMMSLEYGDNVLVVDTGIMFPENDMLGIDYIIPDFGYLKDKRDKIRGIVVTHGHEDHTGAIRHVLEEIPAPIYATPLTRGLLEVKLSRGGMLKGAKLNTVQAGERIKLGPFEVESALIEHPAVAEAGVIGKPDPVAMEVVKAFVALKDGYQPDDKLRRELIRFAREKLGAGTAPREIEFVPSLPKTRSGKIMRRLLKARELGLPEGDTSTLEED